MLNGIIWLGQPWQICRLHWLSIKKALAKYVAQYTNCVEDMISQMGHGVGTFHPIKTMVYNLQVTTKHLHTKGKDSDLAMFKGPWSFHLADGLADVLAEHVYDLPWWKENATAIRQSGRRYKTVKVVTES